MESLNSSHLDLAYNISRTRHMAYHIFIIIDSRLFAFGPSFLSFAILGGRGGEGGARGPTLQTTDHLAIRGLEGVRAYADAE